MSGPVDDARLAELQRLADEFRSDDWTSNYLAGATTALLAELVRLRAEHDQQAQQIEAVRALCKQREDVETEHNMMRSYRMPRQRATECTLVPTSHVLAALVPVQHPPVSVPSPNPLLAATDYGTDADKVPVQHPTPETS